MKILKRNIKVTKNYIKISLVKCFCGNEFEIQNSKIKNQKYCIKCQKNASITHGMSKTRFFRIWTDVKTRGTNRYRIGIPPVGMSEEWKDFNKFLKDMHRSYKKHVSLYSEKNTTIDRISNSKGYSKENCRWATHMEQTTNRRNSIIIRGKTLSEWCRVYKMSYHAAYQRYAIYGWSFEKTFDLIR